MKPIYRLIALLAFPGILVSTSLYADPPANTAQITPQGTVVSAPLEGPSAVAKTYLDLFADKKFTECMKYISAIDFKELGESNKLIGDTTPVEKSMLDNLAQLHELIFNPRSALNDAESSAEGAVFPIKVTVTPPFKEFIKGGHALVFSGLASTYKPEDAKQMKREVSIPPKLAKWMHWKDNTLATFSPNFLVQEKDTWKLLLHGEHEFPVKSFRDDTTAFFGFSILGGDEQ